MLNYRNVLTFIGYCTYILFACGDDVAEGGARAAVWADPFVFKGHFSCIFRWDGPFLGARAIRSQPPVRGLWRWRRHLEIWDSIAHNRPGVGDFSLERKSRLEYTLDVGPSSSEYDLPL